MTFEHCWQFMVSGEFGGTILAEQQKMQHTPGWLCACALKVGHPLHYVGASDRKWPLRGLAGEAGAVELEAVGGAEDGDGDFFGLEELVGEGLELVASNGFDGGQNFVERGEAAEVEFLAGRDWTCRSWWTRARA